MLVFYSGLGRWYYDDFFSHDVPVKIALGGLVRETGIFELGDINKDEVEYSKNSTVYYLKPCEKNEKGVAAPFLLDLGELDIPYFEVEKPVEITDKDIIKEKSGKKTLIKKDKDRSELLLLLYEMFDKYGVRVGIDDRSKLSVKKAWALAVSGEFKSTYIMRIDGEGASTYLIILNDGSKVDWSKFLRTFNRRFK